MNERWKWVPGYQGYYEVSNTGKVRGVDRHVKHNYGTQLMRGKELYQGKTRTGYVVVTLCKDKKKELKTVHRLVARSFLGEPDEGLECCHLDGNKENNSLENLKWATRKTNHSHKKEHGTHICGEKSFLSKLTEQDIHKIFSFRQQGMCQKDIGKIFGVYQQTISKILRRQAWKHI